LAHFLKFFRIFFLTADEWIILKLGSVIQDDKFVTNLVALRITITDSGLTQGLLFLPTVTSEAHAGKVDDALTNPVSVSRQRLTY